MADLSVEDIRKLARGFLTGTAEPKELEAMTHVLEQDPQMGLELLTQMQTALDETAPTQLSPDQQTAADEKIKALFNASENSKKSFSLFGFFKGLFGKKKSIGTARVKGRRKLEELSSEDDVLPMPEVEAAPGMPADEMAPIAPIESVEEVAPETVPAKRAYTADDDMAPIAPTADPLSAAVDSALDKAEERKKKKAGAGLRRGLVWAFTGVFCMALVGGGGWMVWQKFKNRPVVKTPIRPKPKVKPAPTPSPPRVKAYLQRGSFSPPEEILPAEVLHATPVPAGWTQPLGQAEEMDYNGEGRLPLPTKE